ncbi:hypothetical protein VTO42DRAFT_5806 [Malbranchea cinnamomea]
MLHPHQWLQQTGRCLCNFQRPKITERLILDTGCRIAYNSTIYSRLAIELLSVNFVDVLQAVLTAPHASVQDVESSHALDQLRQLKAFEGVVQRHASEIALIHQTLRLTYQQVHALSSVLAEKLNNHVGASQFSHNRIAFCIPPSALAVITILAILKTGRAYVPLDVMDPPRRRLSILEDSGASCLVVTNESPSFPLEGNKKVSLIDISNCLDNWRDPASNPLRSKQA